MAAIKKSDYWGKRFTKLNDTLQKRSADYMKKNVKKSFALAQAEIEKDLAYWYQRFADNNGCVSMADAKKLLTSDQLKELKWDVNQYIKEASKKKITKPGAKRIENASAKWHINRLEGLLLQIQIETEKLYGNQVAGLQAELQSLYEKSYNSSAYEIDKGFELLVSNGPVNFSKVEKVISKPWVGDNKTFSDRLWRDKKALNQALQDELSKAIIRGDDFASAVRGIREKMNVATSSAARLVMTESVFFGTKAQADCFEELGCEEFEFVATLDSRTSETCQDMDGKHYPMEKLSPGHNAPPMHCWCRSCIAPYFNDEFTRDEKRAARNSETSKNVQVPADITYKEWKKRYVDIQMQTEENDLLVGYNGVENIFSVNYDLTNKKTYHDKYEAL